MALPRKLKNQNLFHDGNNFIGLVPEVTLPKLARKMEEYRGGGMDGPVDSDVGGEKLTLDWTAGGMIVEALRKFAATSATAVALRWAGAYQRDDTGEVDAVEVIARGRYSELDFGSAKQGETTAHKYTMSCAYYRLDINGRTEVEIDQLNMIYIVDGEDILADQRRALGV